MFNASTALDGLLRNTTSSVLGGGPGQFSLPSIGGLDLGGVVDMIAVGGGGDALVGRLSEIGGGLLQGLGPLGQAASTVAGCLLRGDVSPQTLLKAASDAGLGGDDPIMRFVMNDLIPGLTGGGFDLSTATNALAALGVQVPPFAQTLLSLANGGGAGGLLSGASNLLRTPGFNPGL